MHHRSKPAEAIVKDRDSNSEEEQGYKANNTESSKVPSRQLDKYINFLPAVAFSANTQASWEALAVSFSAGLLNGGPTSLVYGTLICWSGNLAVAASMAEMASINPTVGAQYRWAALYAPKGCGPPAFWGLIQGWVTVFGWMAVVASPAFLVGTIAQGLIVLNNESYVRQNWHGTLLTWALLAIPAFCNIFARRVLPTIEIIGGITHTLFWVVWVVVLLTMARRSSKEYVFTETYSGLQFGGWSSQGVSWCVGLLTAAFPLSAFDGVIHMSDEVKDAERKIPQSMVLSVFINGIQTFILVIVLLLCIGDPVAALTTPTGYPIIEILRAATGSKAGATVLMVMLSWNGLVALFSSLASVSRLTWAFARDRGLPFPDFFGRVHPTLRIPLRALCLVLTVVTLLMLLNLGSTSAIYAILSLNNLALYTSYLQIVGSFFIFKLRGGKPAWGPFTLGKWGYAINIYALCFLVFIIVWLPFPPFLPVTAVNMNYSGPIFGLVLSVALLDWFTWGRKRFAVPTNRSVFDEQ
ncbi:hypothetical protein LTR37_019697 [Vermiconidia calcicola]|uniref:Uncharacterized protein n=1 Tax=Vermiconidia calcicola TaxID=1690605 RepID=A0ACC3MDC5_9PEZI|nr:hypothetical protein LTR37_019697 [Vermiconidia calcicola]